MLMEIYMDVTRTVAANKTLASTFEKKDGTPAGTAKGKGDQARLDSVQESLMSIKEQILNEEAPRSRDQLQLS